MEKTTLSKDVEILANGVIIKESTEVRLDRNQLENKLRDVQQQKERTREQNERIVEEYNHLLEEEADYKDMISKLSQPSEMESI